MYGSLLKMSAATIDRVLAPQRERCGRRTAIGVGNDHPSVDSGADVFGLV